MPVKRTSGKAKTKDVFGHLHKAPKMLRAALYARVSTLDQQTLPMQMRAMRDYAANRGWTVAMQVKEVGSGAVRREQRQQLIDAARRREIDVVLVWRLDRWGRSLLDLVTTLQELIDLNIGFVSLTEALDLTTSTGRAMAGMLSVFAAFEHDILRERVRAGLDHARQSGTRLGRPPTAAIKAAEVRKLFRQGISKSEISRRLDIGRTSVRRILAQKKSNSAALRTLTENSRNILVPTCINKRIQREWGVSQQGAVSLTVEEEQTLSQWARAGTSEHRMVERAKVILLLAEGVSNLEVARRLKTRPARVSKWRQRFASRRLEGLRDAERKGRPSTYDKATDKRVLALLDEPPPEGYGKWSGPLLARVLMDVSDDHVWRILRQYDICLERRRSWCISTDPEFGSKAADIVGLYLNPPENALVLCVDEKPSIQALERAQGWLRLPSGKSLNGFSHGYQRHGTTTLFAAFSVATGQVQAGHYSRRRRREFLDFMNDVVASHPGREIHVILDNLNTHKPKDDRWLRSHPQVHLHFTPTYSSWLNQVECWFSILSKQALTGVSFTSPKQLRDAMDLFIAAYNETASPFEWTKAVVHPTGPKAKYADLCK